MQFNTNYLHTLYMYIIPKLPFLPATKVQFSPGAIFNRCHFAYVLGADFTRCHFSQGTIPTRFRYQCMQLQLLGAFQHQVFQVCGFQRSYYYRRHHFIFTYKYIWGMFQSSTRSPEMLRLDINGVISTYL